MEEHTTVQYKNKHRGHLWKANVELIYCILLSTVHTFLIENDAEILHAHYTWKVAFTNLIHKQSIHVNL